MNACENAFDADPISTESDESGSASVGAGCARRSSRECPESISLSLSRKLSRRSSRSVDDDDDDPAHRWKGDCAMCGRATFSLPESRVRGRGRRVPRAAHGRFAGQYTAGSQPRKDRGGPRSVLVHPELFRSSASCLPVSLDLPVQNLARANVARETSSPPLKIVPA